MDLIIRISKYYNRIVSLICLLFVIIGLSCSQNSGKDYKVFEAIDFTSGDFKLYGFVTEGDKTKFENEIGDFCISDILTLQKMKNNWVIHKSDKRMSCGFNYILCLVKQDSLIIDFAINTKCGYLTNKNYWYDFDESLLSDFKNRMNKLTTDSAKIIQNRLMNRVKEK